MFEELLKKCDKLMKEMQELQVRIDELYKKLNNKQTTELPCNVGDFIYILYNNHINYKFYKGRVVSIEIFNNDICFYTDLFTKHIEDYNVTWFTDKAKAEERLKELNNEN